MNLLSPLPATLSSEHVALYVRARVARVEGDDADRAFGATEQARTCPEPVHRLRAARERGRHIRRELGVPPPARRCQVMTRSSSSPPSRSRLPSLEGLHAQP